MAVTLSGNTSGQVVHTHVHVIKQRAEMFLGCEGNRGPAWQKESNQLPGLFMPLTCRLTAQYAPDRVSYRLNAGVRDMLVVVFVCRRFKLCGIMQLYNGWLGGVVVRASDFARGR